MIQPRKSKLSHRISQSLSRRTSKHVKLRHDHTSKIFWMRTVSAQLHFLGAVGAFIGALVLLNRAWHQDSVVAFTGVLVYALTGLLVFCVSSGYHFLSDGFLISEKLGTALEHLDHSAIYLFIAGTYTPFVMHVIAEPWRTRLLILIWSIGLLGVAYTITKMRLPKILRGRFLYTGLFVAMGWAAVIRLPEIIEKAHGWAIQGLILGGLAYSIGAVVYATKKPRLWEGVFGFHELWHILVMVGFAFHYVMILSFYL